MLALPWYQRQAKIFPSQTDTNQHPYEYWCKKFSAECYQTKFHSIRVMLPWPSGIRSGTQGQLSATTSMWYATLTEPRGKPTKCSSQIDVQNALDKTHHPLVIKSAQKTENRRWPLPQPHKGPLGQAGGWVHSLVRWKASHWDEECWGCPLVTSFIILEVLAWAGAQEKGGEGDPGWKEEVKSSLFADDMIFMRKILTNPQKMLEVINKFSTQKSLISAHFSSKQSEEEIKKKTATWNSLWRSRLRRIWHCHWSSFVATVMWVLSLA